MRPDSPYGRPSRQRAFRQWARMTQVLQYELGIPLYLLEPDPARFDMAFACDPGLWIDDLFIPSNFGVPRQGEVKHFIRWFLKRGIRVHPLSSSAQFEGGDCVVVRDGKKTTVVIGYGDVRTNEMGVREVTKILKRLGIDVLPIRRITQEFFHLNSAFTFFSSANLVSFYIPALEPRTIRLLQDHFSCGVTYLLLQKNQLFRYHPDFGDEYRYGHSLNQIEHRGISLQPYCGQALRALLAAHKISVVVPEDGSSEFERSGGSFRCLVMLHHTTKN
ncbi:MAG: hypothetical protein HYS57_02110 [Parcubacteria group bacterium]|nr:hypothetical protein [Parcubacteria group bacterium]